MIITVLQLKLLKSKLKSRNFHSILFSQKHNIPTHFIKNNEYGLKIKTSYF